MFSARIQDHVLLAQNTLDYSNSSTNITNGNDASNKGKPGIVILYSKHSTKDDVKMKESTFSKLKFIDNNSICGFQSFLAVLQRRFNEGRESFLTVME